MLTFGVLLVTQFDIWNALRLLNCAEVGPRTLHRKLRGLNSTYIGSLGSASEALTDYVMLCTHGS